MLAGLPTVFRSGFSDVTTNLVAPHALTTFFSKTLPRYADGFRARFENNRKLLQHYAIEMGLERDTRSEKRAELYNQFRRELLASSQEREDSE